MLTARVTTPFLMLVMCLGSAAQEEPSLISNKEIASYAIGTQVGNQVLQSLRSQPVPLVGGYLDPQLFGEQMRQLQFSGVSPFLS